MDRSSRGEAVQAGTAGGARRRAAHEAGQRWCRARRPGDSAGGGIDQRGRGPGLLRSPVRPLPHLRRHLPPQLWA